MGATLFLGYVMNELLSSGIELMLVGMGIVFTFLSMLVVFINGMSSLIQRFFPETPIVAQQGDDPRMIAAISAAVHQYRKKYSKN